MGQGAGKSKDERKGREEGGRRKREGKKEGWFSPGNSKKHPRI